VQRDIETLRLSVSRVEADLNRTLGASWTCTIDDQYRLTVAHGDQTEMSLLQSDVEDEQWYVKSDQAREERAAALEADADEAVATEVTEILHVMGIVWPTCPQHSEPLWNCEGWWGCNGPDSHDIALLGSLGLVG
jgi:hypothetical protein